jgi:ABC-type microcin C transport system duplicated ATPase subunit YejF
MVPDIASAALLDVHDLRAVYDSARGPVHALNGVSFTVQPGEVLALVGESGSGKSASALAIMGLLPRTRGRITAGRVLFDDVDLLTLPESKIRALRGNEIALVFQNPMTTLNPTSTIGTQFREVLREHTGASRRAADARAVELLRLVDVSDPKGRLDCYPHQLSGGLRQRVMIAPPPHSMSPPKHRFCGYCGGSPPNWVRRSWSSPTAWVWSPAWPTG